jgi:hypothetical protein
MRWSVLVLALAGCSVAPPSKAVIAAHALAERFYQVGDYEVTLVECKRMLELDPYDAPAEAARLAQFETWVAEGRTQLLFGDLDLAEQYGQLAFDAAPLLPPEMDVELRLTQARALLDWVKASRDNEEE